MCLLETSFTALPLSDSERENEGEIERLRLGFLGWEIELECEFWVVDICSLLIFGAACFSYFHIFFSENSGKEGGVSETNAVFRGARWMQL